MTNVIEDLDQNALEAIIEQIYSLSGITISTTRKAMVQGRLRKRIRELDLSSYTAYLDLVKTSQDEQIKFVDMLTTNETTFFRTPRIWNYLLNQYLPKWMKEHPGQTFKAWSAAASSGEEAHSLAILCLVFQNLNPNFKFQIFGSDISHQMIEKCKLGLFSDKAIQGLNRYDSSLYNKYIQKIDNDTFKISDKVKQHLTFKPHNLFATAPNTNHFDLVLVRNVLIYFKANDQEKVLQNLERSLVNDGVLVIGESESLSHIKTDFEHLEPLIYRKKFALKQAA